MIYFFPQADFPSVIVRLPLVSLEAPSDDASHVEQPITVALKNTGK